MFNTNLVSIALFICLLLIIGFIAYRQVKENLTQDDPILHRLKVVTEPIHPVMKNLKLYKSKKSYTINKDRIYLCIKDKNGKYYPLNMLVYVLCHEVAHLLNKKDVGHTEEFHRIFDELLEKAVECGAYNPSIPIISNYSQH